ncbi:MAG: hypothetical protein AAB620_00625 [Patescibacteria group bacterium]
MRRWTTRKVLYLASGVLSIVGVAVVQRGIAVAPILVVLVADYFINVVIPHYTQ